MKKEFFIGNRSTISCKKRKILPYVLIYADYIIRITAIVIVLFFIVKGA